MSEFLQSDRIVDAKAALDRLRANMRLAILGKDDVIEHLLICLAAGGHVLIEDLPGVGKTTLAYALARSTDCAFSRIQFTSDLLPSDVTGVAIYDETTREFVFKRGPVFANIVLADEINRAPPKTQSALLEAMEEQQVTTDDGTVQLGRPFLVLATQNPIEYEGTYPLPEAQLDRFLVRLRVGYPSREDEWQMLERRLERRADEVELTPVVDAIGLVAMQRAIEAVHVSSSVGRYIVDLVAATRVSPSVQVGASPRGTLALMKLARAKAALGGRDFVVPDDVKAVAVAALAHRLTLRPELWVQRVQGDEVVEECLGSVPTPAASDRAVQRG